MYPLTPCRLSVLMILVLNCICPFVFHSSFTTHTLFGVRAYSEAAAFTIPQIPFLYPGILHDHDTLYPLRGTLQQHLLPHQSDAPTVLFHRDRCRYRRSSLDRRWSRDLCNHFPNHRPHQVLPPSYQNPDTDHGFMLLDIHMGPSI